MPAGGRLAVSDFDDDKTPPKPSRRITTDEKRAHWQAYPPGTPVVMTSDDRALAGLSRRRDAVVIDVGDDSTTDPLILAQRTAPNPHDPGELIRAAFTIAKEQMRKERESAEQAQRRDLEALLNRAPKDVADHLVSRMVALETKLGAIEDLSDKLTAATEYIDNQKRSVARLRNMLIGSVILVAGFIYHRGTGDENSRMRLETQEKALAEIRGWLNPQPSHSRWPDFWPPQPKGPDK